MIAGDFVEGRSLTVVLDWEPAAVEAVLDFIYADDIDDADADWMLYAAAE